MKTGMITDTISLMDMNAMRMRSFYFVPKDRNIALEYMPDKTILSADIILASQGSQVCYHQPLKKIHWLRHQSPTLYSLSNHNLHTLFLSTKIHHIWISCYWVIQQYNEGVYYKFNGNWWRCNCSQTEMIPWIYIH